MTNINYLLDDLRGELTLNKIRNLIPAFKDSNVLVGITCSADLFDYLLTELAVEKANGDFYGVDMHKIEFQKEPIKYFYSKKELRDYLGRGMDFA